MFYSNPLYYIVPLNSEEYEMYRDAKKQPHTPVKPVSSDLYDPMSGLIRGNMFKGEYRGYKDYQAGIVKPKDERDAMMQDVMMYSFAAHDLSLKLDIFPTDRDLLKKFEEYRDKANEAIKAYQSKYGPLTPAAAEDKNGTFSWVLVPSAWEKK